jgi:cellulose synthase/poly-beta-1,6-N-acetylglucosamine synthase-like glycosyltransferase
MIFLEALLAVLAFMLLIPTLVFGLQVLLTLLPGRKVVPVAAADCRLAVLIPAHNESSGIVATLDSLRPQLKAGDRLLVVADNCSDDTASIAVQNGAEVIERNDSANRGKGFALDFGIRHLSANPPDILVIVDADCIAGERVLEKLVAHAHYHDRPTQALYLMQAPDADTGLKSKVAEFAWIVKNRVRPSGFARLNLPCQLMGTGMAFPWDAITGINLANGNIVEDMKLGIDLARIGKAPMFYDDALVTSYFPTSADVQSGQRARWEHGHLAMILSESPKLLVQGLIAGRKDLVAMALDLSIPPLALLVAMIVIGLAVSTVAMGFGMSALPLKIMLCAALILGVSVAAAWWGWGRKVISLTAFLFIPIYVISKIPHYFRFLFKRQKTWNRTERD